MKKLSKILFLILLLSALRYPLNAANAAIPRLINYQGRLTDKNDIPLNGAYNLSFRIYDAETAGSLLWEEAHSGLLIQKGIFSVQLGSVTSLNLAFDKQYWLEVKVGEEVMSPRQRIASSAYAIRAEESDSAVEAQNANTVGNVGISSTPAANKILPLDNNAKIPQSAVGLKVYDSGWFAVSANSSYTKTHNLGIRKVLVNVYGAQDSNGSNMVVIPNRYWEQSQFGGNLIDITTTQITFKTTTNLDIGPDRVNPFSYARIIILALE